MHVYSVTGHAGENPKWDLIQHFASPTLMRWGWDSGKPPQHPIPGLAVVRASIVQLDEAITLLGERAGDRADAARAWLTAERDRCARALDALEPLTNEAGGFPGAGFDQLFAEYAARLAGASAAKAALARSTTATVRLAREQLDLAEARIREFTQGELAELLDRLAWPAPPAAATLDAARADTAALHAQARDTDKPATLLALALDQGRKATAEVALLYIVHERPAAKGALATAYDLRAALHAESGGAGKAKPATHDALTAAFEEPARWSPGHAVFSGAPYVRKPVDPMTLRELA